MVARKALEQFPNLVSMFFARAAERRDAPFLWAKQDDAWQSISWRAAADQVRSLAAALKAEGIRPGDRVMLVSENRPEWCLADLAIMAAGAVTVPTYTTNTERDHLHILENSGARAAFVSTAKLARVFLPAAMRSTCCKTVIGFERLRGPQAGDLRFASYSDLIERHAPEEIVSTAVRSDTACIIYTSGTGGAPRGVKQHHGAILCNVDGCVEVIAEDFGWGDEIFLSFLPASHAYEHTGGQFLPIALGGQIYYAESLEKLASNIEEVRPTIMVVVPRLFEVLRQRIVRALEKQGGSARYMMGRALEIGARTYAGERRLRDMPMDLLLDRVFRPRIRQRFGGRMKAMVSGGAPLNPEVGIFFSSLGLTLLQGYGQTEAGPVISCNRPRAKLRMETAGPPLKGVEVRIADDGEILVRGELVMEGYWQNPEETARVLRDGWLHTGDIGVIDADGHLRITDRKKDLIVNDKGDNVSPQRVEGMLTLEPEIMQAMVVGDRRPYLVGLIVPDPEWLAEWTAASGKAAGAAGLADDPDLHRALAAAVDRVNAGLSVTEKVRRFVVAGEAFSIENEELTPSMKIRRHVIRSRYGAQLDALYRHERS